MSAIIKVFLGAFITGVLYLSGLAFADPVEKALELARDGQAGESKVTENADNLTPESAEPDSSGPEQAAYPGVENKKLETGGNGQPGSIIYYPVLNNPAVDSKLRQFAEDLAETYSSEVREGVESDGEKPESWDRWEQTGFFTLTRPNPDVVSVMFDVYRYTGGVHGQIYIAIFNFDLKTGQLLDLKDLFANPQKALEIMSRLSAEKLRKSLGEDVEEDMLRDGTEPTEVNFANLSLLPQGLAVEFQPYQVGPWAIGQQHVDISLEELSEAGPNPVIWPNLKNASQNLKSDIDLR